MFNTLLQSLPLVVQFSLLASAFGAISYAVCRSLERLWPPITYLFHLLLAASLIYWISAGGVPLIGWLLPVTLLVIPALLGGWFHRRSGGHSINAFQAFRLSYLSIVLSVVLNYLAISLGLPDHFIGMLPLTFGWPAHVVLAYKSYMLGIIAYPVLAPLALWIWQSQRIHPGIDEALVDKETAPYA
jgi:hypothetical protein